jgi:hypothetical protein
MLGLLLFCCCKEAVKSLRTQGLLRAKLEELSSQGSVTYQEEEENRLADEAG